MCDYQTFFELQDPYSVAQVLVRKMLEKLTAEQVIEYSGNLEKLWNTKVIDKTALILEIFGQREGYWEHLHHILHKLYILLIDFLSY